ncbi:hypothetical protein [Prevotella aurantiaca]|uniref:hypothetical protein n=1 Tax=Prevotella aurantiaca TaxID=596085 RepID=UPI0028E6D3E6|nr:hypothetical protein [Prevotella aurantiaca]
MKERSIKILEYQGEDGLPKAKDVFYLCLNCRKIVASMQSGKCLCGNILIDTDGGRGGFNDASQALILKIE